jgi:uncharacterized protein (DUF2236 family)
MTLGRPTRTLVTDALRAVPGLGGARDRLAGAVVGLLTDGQGPADLDAEVTVEHPGDPGLFGPDSVTWRIHSDLSMLVGGVRSLLVQALHPLAMTGVARHSNFREDPLGRLARTGAYVGVTTFGAVPEAEQMIRMVQAVHRSVEGVAADGRPYSASDPATLAWVHNVEIDSFLRAYQRYGSERLSATDADRYVDEMTAVLTRFGVEDPALLPRTAADLQRWILTHPEQARIPETGEAVRFMVLPPLPPTSLPAYGVLAAAAVGLIPVRQRRMLGLAAPVPFSALDRLGPVGTSAGRMLEGAADRAGEVSAGVFDVVAVRPAAQTIMGVMGWALGPDSPGRVLAERRVAAGATAP